MDQSPLNVIEAYAVWMLQDVCVGVKQLSFNMIEPKIVDDIGVKVKQSPLNMMEPNTVDDMGCLRKRETVTIKHDGTEHRE